MSDAAAFVRCGLVWTTLAFGFAAGSLAVGAEIPRLDDVLAAWRKRQDAVSAVHVEFTEQRTDLKGSMNRLTRLIRNEHIGDLPAEDTTIRASCVLVGSDNRSRYTFDGQCWQLDKGELVPRRALEVFDGREHRMLLSELGPEKYSQMVISVPGPNPVEPTLLPICWHFWPLRAAFGGFPVDDLGLTGKGAEVDGRVCAVVEQRPNAAQGRRDSWEYWIDPKDGYLVRRAYQRDSRDAILKQIDLAYDREESGEYALSEWTAQMFVGGQLQQRYKYTISNIVLNPPVTDADFKVEPPLGALVFESTSHTPSFVHDDGVLRPVESKAATYSVMVAEEKQRAGAAAQRLPAQNAAKQPARRRAEVTLSNGMFGLSSLQFHKLRGEPVQDGDALLSFCVWIDGAPVEGTVVAEKEMTAHEPNKDDDDEDLLRRRWRIRVADSTFDQLVFGKDSDDDERRARLSGIVAMKVEEVDGICRLTEAQKDKLTLAGRGDIQRLQDRIAALRNRVRQNVDIHAKPVELVKQSRALLYDLLSESQSVRLTIASGLFQPGSLFAKTLGTTLTADQAAAYERHRSSKLAAAARSAPPTSNVGSAARSPK